MRHFVPRTFLFGAVIALFHIEREQDPAVFATFDAICTQPKRNLFAGFPGGAPGKGLPLK